MAPIADSQRQLPALRSARDRSPKAMVSASETKPETEEAHMDWNRVEGNWKQIKGKVKEQWGQLTDDDLDTIDGKQDQLEGKLQQRYGYQKDQAKKELNDWFGRQNW
jgi:uncharacterized protein YjbJ (UPF0337 family)